MQPVNSIEEVKAHIGQLTAENNWQQAIDELVEMNKIQPKFWAEQLLREIRIEAYDHLKDANKKSDQPCPPACEDPFKSLVNKIPEIDASEINVTNIAGAIGNHGSLIVRNLLSKEVTDELVQHIDNIMDQGGEFYADPKTFKKNSLFAPIPNTPKLKNLNRGTKMMQESGSMYTMFSPLMAERLLSLFTDLQLKPVIESYFDSTPCLSLKKWVLRKMKPLTFPPDWHQDGSFMGKDIKSLNLWIALTDCGEGTNKAGMDIVPNRLNELVPTGTEGAIFDWSVSQKYVADNFKDSKPERPTFKAGDAIFFDHLNLHATSFSEEYTDIRYAIETWFFDLHASPENQIPIVW